MNISEFCIRRPVFTTLLMLAITVGGIAGYSTLPINSLPDVDLPTIQVSASLPGASPESMASSIATPLERQFSTIPGITSMVSTSYLGNVQITLQFDLSRNMDGAALDVQSALSAVSGKLPKEMPSPPTFFKVNPSEQPVIFIAVSSETLPLSAVNEYADTYIAQRISMLPGVAQVNVYGAQKYAIRVRLHPDALAARSLTPADVANALSQASSITPTGVIDTPNHLYTLEIVGQPKDAAAFKNMIIHWQGNTPVRLSDVADVQDSVADTRSISFLNGKQAIMIAVQRQPGENTVAVVQHVRSLFPAFRDILPASITMTPLFDRSVYIQHSIKDVQFTLQITIAIVILVIFLFLRKMSATLIPALTIPFSILGTYGCMALLGFSLNNVSLLALVLCVGFVVDDAIVVLENIMRHIEAGEKPFDAAIKGSKEIGFTILSMTFSLVGVFIPILFMGGIVGKLFYEFAVTLSVAILISGFVALTLSPMLSSLLPQHIAHDSTKPESRFSQTLERGFSRLLYWYEISLAWAFNNRRWTLLLTVITLIVSVALYMYIPKGFFPLEDTGFVFAQTESDQDISFAEMQRRQTEAATIIQADPSVDAVFSALGSTRGATNTGRIFFALKEERGRDSIFKVIERLRGQLSHLQGIQVYMQPVQNLSVGARMSKGLYQYTLQAFDVQSLQTWGTTLEQAIRTVPGIEDVSSDLQLNSLQVQIDIDRDKAQSLGIDYNTIRQTLYYAYGVAEVGRIYLSTNDYQILLEVDLAHQKSIDDLRSLHIKTQSGQMVSLDSIATFSRTHAPLLINHERQLPSATISFNLSAGTSLSEVVKHIETIQSEIKLPDSITGSFQGMAGEFKQSNKGTLLLLLLAIVVIYIILGMLYESFMHPITILSGLPSAGIGAIIALLLFNMDLNVISMIGIILLVGIVKKNAIMMIDFALAAKAQAMDSETAIRQACLIRFRPIMMTTMAALFGTLPIALGIGAGAELRQPLGIAVVGGLLFSQFITLYITPIVFLYLESAKTSAGKYYQAWRTRIEY